MATRKETVAVKLDEADLCLVDMYRQGVKLRTGKLPTRSDAITVLIRDGARGPEPQPLRKYAELVKAVANHGDRIDSLEAAVVPLLEAAEAEE